MRAKQLRLRRITTSLKRHAPRKVATTLALGALAVALAISTGAPAFAGKPDHRQHGGHHAQQQERDLSADGKRKNNKNKAVKRTFSSDAAIAIPDGVANPYPATIAVSGFKKARISDLNLTLRGLGHANPRDVDVLLVSPSGRNAVVMSDVGQDPAGASGVVNLTLRLDDEAAASLPLNERLTDGSFRPTIDSGVFEFPDPAPEASANTALSTFDGINPNGQWQLFIHDRGFGDTGSMTGWELEITAKSKAKSKGKKKR